MFLQVRSCQAHGPLDPLCGLVPAEVVQGTAAFWCPLGSGGDGWRGPWPEDCGEPPQGYNLWQLMLPKEANPVGRNDQFQPFLLRLHF